MARHLHANVSLKEKKKHHICATNKDTSSFIQIVAFTKRVTGSQIRWSALEEQFYNAQSMFFDVKYDRKQKTSLKQLKK